MSRSDSDSGCGCIVVIAIFAIIACVSKCNSSHEGNDSGEDTIVSDTIISSDTEEFVRDTLVEKYIDNRLSSGSHPYANEYRLNGSDSRISVKTSSGDCDVVVIVKSSNKIVRNTYLQAGASTTFDVPNGTYQLFFYYGQGWYPEKEMPNGMLGGFVAKESVSKDDPQSLNGQELTYELILQTDGNFNTQPSNVNEAF